MSGLVEDGRPPERSRPSDSAPSAPASRPGCRRIPRVTLRTVRAKARRPHDQCSGDPHLHKPFGRLADQARSGR
jgi:hypothetical protein